MKIKLLIALGCMLIATSVVAESTETISIAFKDFPKGTSYAENEEHDLGGGLVVYTTQCYFTTELRIYSSGEHNGYVVSNPLPGVITKMTFNAAYPNGYSKDILNVYGSTGNENWTLINKGLEISSTSYRNYTLDFPIENGYTCFKLDVNGNQQIRIASMSVTYLKDEEVIVVSAPIFNPISTSFSTEFIDITIEAAEGYEIYYTKDGSTPSYTNDQEYNGIKGKNVTIYAAESKVTLNAIAVNPITGKCSNVSSATYTYARSVEDEEMGESETNPYTVEDVLGTNIYKPERWTRGTIYGVGIVKDDKLQSIVTSDFTVNSNIVMGDENAHILVQLPTENNVRRDLNLKDHPYLKGKDILIYGNLDTYYGVRGIKESSKYKITHNVPINSYGYATLYLDMPVSVPEGTTAYYCIVEGNYAELLPVGSVIPSNTGVIIESTPNITCSLTYTTGTNSNALDILAENQLVGFLQDTVVKANGYAYYALNVKDNKLGFYIPQTATDKTDAAAGFTAKANKSYLQVPAEQKVKMFVINRENAESAIIPITHVYDDVIYDLQGRAVYAPTLGIYVKNGKKVVIRK